jgi:hypothetical protein
MLLIIDYKLKFVDPSVTFEQSFVNIYFAKASMLQLLYLIVFHSYPFYKAFCQNIELCP